MIIAVVITTVWIQVTKLIYPMSSSRNIDDVLRLLDFDQFTALHPDRNVAGSVAPLDIDDAE